MTLAADEAALTEAYGHFKQEAQQLRPDYRPQTVNIDGWLATQNAWQALFKTIVIIHCFLHAFLKIRDRCQRLKTVFPEIKRQVWSIYRAKDKADFQKLVVKTDLFLLAFDYPQAYRTSNRLDRHMDPMARWLFATCFFHGHWSAAELQVRAWALFHNFWPYCPRAKISRHFISPAHQLNGFVCHQNWLHNLLISASSAACHANHRKRQN